MRAGHSSTRSATSQIPGSSAPPPAYHQTAGNARLHARALQFGAHHLEQFHRARFQNLVDEPARRFTRTFAVPRMRFDKRQLHRAVPGGSLRNRAAELMLHNRRRFERDAKSMRQVARKMIAADPQRSGQLRRFAVVTDHLRRMRADVDQRHAFTPVLRQHGSVAAGDRLHRPSRQPKDARG